MPIVTKREPSVRRGRPWLAAGVMVLLVAAAAVLPNPAVGDQASQPSSPAAGFLSTGYYHSCAVLPASTVRCWGYGGDGQLGYGNGSSIGDDETPSSAGPVDLGAGRTAKAVSAGGVHTCALRDDNAVLCWGYSGDGRLGYPARNNIGLIDLPGAVGPVDIGAGRTAKAITAGGAHSCAILDNDTVRCWGFGFDGRLGYNSTESIGNDELPSTAGPIDFGPGRTAKAISAGGAHTCAILDDDTVRCWGFGNNGRLGYGNTDFVGRGCIINGTQCLETPDAPSAASVGPVSLGAGRTARAISAGEAHTCAVLDNATVRCWGSGSSGRLGYGNSTSIGDNELPSAVGPVNLGAGRTAKAIDAGGSHTCVVLDDDSVRCWGFGAFGQLGLGNADAVGNTPTTTPGDVAPVDLGAGSVATAIAAGDQHTCASIDVPLLAADAVRCWGRGSTGRLGYCSEATIGDSEAPATIGPVDLGVPGISGTKCPAPPSATTPPPPPPPPGVVIPQQAAPEYPNDALAAALAAQRARAARLRACQRTVTRRLAADRRRARTLPAARRRAALRLAARRAAQRRRACARRHGRTPGRVTRLSARAGGARSIRLTFDAVGTDGRKPPAARSYVIKQSTRPIRTARDFARAPALCNGKCSFNVTVVGARLTLTITQLRRRGVYHYAIAARDNVSGRNGPRSRTISTRAG